MESDPLVRSPRPVLAVALVLGVTLLAGCGAENGTTTGSTGGTAAATAPLAGAGLEAVTATGPVDHKTAPKVVFSKTPVSTATVTRKVLTPGTGPAATKADTVTARMQIFNGTTGKMLDNSFTADRKPDTFRLGRTDLIKGLIEGFVGAQKDARVAFTIPPQLAFGSQGNEQLGIGGKDTLVVVADVSEVRPSPTQVTGTQKPTPAGLPKVDFPGGPTKEPKVTVPKTAAPTKLQVVTLIEGKGKTVAKGEMITSQYHGVLWKDGSIFDSSWQRGTPADFPIGVGQVIPGWDKALVGKKVGSRLLIVVPPAEGYGSQGMPPKISGTDTLVFVVDILDAY